MQAGKLRNPITIEQPPSTADSYGEIDRSDSAGWTTFETAWAEVKQLSGREQFYAQEVVPTATHQVTLRYVAGVDPTMRVIFQSRKLYIGDVNDLEGRHRTLVLICTEKK